MMIVGLVLCLVIWYVMQGGNAACGKTVGTLMGIGCIAIPVIAIGAFIFIGLIPFFLCTLPVIASIVGVCYIAGKFIGRGKPKAAATGDGSGVVRWP
jgi:hypothetical protein